MARYKDFSYEQTTLVPVSFKKQIGEGSFEDTLCELIDNDFDLSVFDEDFRNDDTGRPAWNPAILLKIIIYAYSKGIISSRKIAQACDESVIFMALSANSHPHFTTIADFVTRMQDKILELFKNVLLVCYDMNLIEGNMFAVDGCKLPSNASMEWNGTKADLAKKQAKLEKKLGLIIKKHRERDKHEVLHKEVVKKDKARAKRLRKSVKKIKDFLANNADKPAKRRGLLQSNVTDNESAKMNTSHGFIQGYNGVSMVDSKCQVVVHAEAFGKGEENDLLIPMIKETESNMCAVTKRNRYLKGRKIIADTGFNSEDNLRQIAEQGIDAYIPNNHFRKRDPRFKDAPWNKPKKIRFLIEDFDYDKKRNVYICPAGKELRMTQECAVFINFTGKRYEARIKDCRACRKRIYCIRNNSIRPRTLLIPNKRHSRTYSAIMVDKMDTLKGRETYDKRMGIVEPVFGNIRTNKRLDRFTLRSKKKVNVQWVLYNMVHNIEKINQYGRN